MNIVFQQKRICTCQLSILVTVAAYLDVASEIFSCVQLQTRVLDPVLISKLLDRKVCAKGHKR